ncbi:hypothetical protein HZA26_02570 [Candidatus Nomurabacteria bacterium]|nr:hypothetical protein [Candidatus Nomurabacteria bacterium]
MDDGKIKIEVSKTSDGTFPVIHTLNFKNKPWSSDQKMFLAYLCVSSDENNDINHKLYLCNPQTSYKISRIQITSKDNKLLLTELTLKDPKCENTLQYDVGSVYTSFYCLDSSETSKFDTNYLDRISIDDSFFEPMWAEEFFKYFN